MIIYIVTEDEIDYDWEETPILTNVKLRKAFNSRELAESFIGQLGISGLEIKEVELI